jgi:membrane protease YdiL (CAAX protease family)
VPERFLRPAGIVGTVCYVAIYFVTLSFARRQQSLTCLGITGGHWLIAIIIGVVLGIGGAWGVAQDLPGGTFFPSVGWLRILTLVCTGVSAGFIEAVVFYGYFQFRLRDAFGAPIAVLGTVFSWVALHAVVISIPGAGTFGAQDDIISFLVGISVGFLVLCTAVELTNSIWAGALANMMANVYVNLYMLSVRPEQVLIADPKDLPVDGLAFILVITGLVLTRQRIKSEQRAAIDAAARHD